MELLMGQAYVECRESKRVWTLNQAAVAGSWRVKFLFSGKFVILVCSLCIIGREDGGDREPAV